MLFLIHHSKLLAMTQQQAAQNLHKETECNAIALPIRRKTKAICYTLLAPTQYQRIKDNSQLLSVALNKLDITKCIITNTAFNQLCEFSFEEGASSYLLWCPYIEYCLPFVAMPKLKSVDHLFLLMGENPLPNYLATMLLLAEAGSLYLIRTERTKPQADRLIKALRASKEAPRIGVERHIVLGQSKKEHPQEIYQEIHSTINNANSNGINGKVGLHYTGGNKVMAIHAYRAVNNLDCEKQFSYLDSETLSIGIEDNGYFNFVPVEQDISLSTIFDLHGIAPDLENAYSSKPRLAAVSNKIAQSIIEASITDKGAYNKTFKKLTKEIRRNVLNEAGLIEKIDKPPEEKAEFVSADKIFTEKLLQQGNFSNSKSAKDWAGGAHWLEDYVLQQVSKIAKEWAINDAGVDFPLLVPGGQSIRGYKGAFQLDVIFMRHYQLFTVSCTTSPDKKDCKQKLLEAYVRARQIGGSEARVALVCGAWEPDDIKAEIDISIKDDKVRVFGYRDWPNLSEKIAAWIEDLQRNLS